MVILSLAQSIQVCSCLFMTGVIWLVQLLVYPNFRLIEADRFRQFHQFHQQRITWLVAPVMVLELISGVWLYYARPSPQYLFNLISIILIWSLTSFVSVPLHNELERHRLDRKEKLILSNWLRTLVWSMRSLFWLFFIAVQSAAVELARLNTSV